MSVRGYDSFLVTTGLGANRKVRRLTPAERWCAVHGVWAIAAESPERGCLWIADGVPATEKDYAELAGVSVAVAKSTVRKMRELGMLEPEPGDGAEYVHDWDQHQREPKPSDSAESRRDRKRKSRERHTDVTRDKGKSHAPEVEVEDEGKNSKEASPPLDPTRLEQARTRLREGREVFDAWVTATERDPQRTKFIPERKRIIEKALKSHGLEVCLRAVTRIGKDAWARGANDRSQRFDDIKHALGNAERIERWSDAGFDHSDDGSFLDSLQPKHGLAHA